MIRVNKLAIGILCLFAAHSECRADQATQTQLLVSNWIFEGDGDAPIVMSFVVRDGALLEMNICKKEVYLKQNACKNAKAPLVSYNKESDSFCRAAYSGAATCSLRYRVDPANPNKVLETLLSTEPVKIYKSVGRKL